MEKIVANRMRMLATLDFSQHVSREKLILVKGPPWTSAFSCVCEKGSRGRVEVECLWGDVGSLLNSSGLKAFALHYWD